MCKNYVVDVEVGKGRIQTQCEAMLLCHGCTVKPSHPEVTSDTASLLLWAANYFIFAICFTTLPVAQTTCTAANNRMIHD
jgi:hypothetical protein